MPTRSTLSWRRAPVSRAPCRRQADFAAALIAHRIGLADDYLGDEPAAEGVPGVRPDCSVPLGFSVASPAQVQTALLHLCREPFGIEYAEAPAFHVRCQDENSVILLNRDLFATDAMDHLGRRRMIGGVVVTRIAAIYDYFPTLILLMTPRSRSHIDLRLYSPKGTLRYVGSGDLKSSGMHFQIRSVPLPGSVPVEVSGIYGASGDSHRVGAGRGPAARETPSGPTGRDDERNMISLREISTCVGLTGGFSVVRDFFGYRQIRFAFEVSLLSQARLLRGPHIHLRTSSRLGASCSLTVPRATSIEASWSFERSMRRSASEWGAWNTLRSASRRRMARRRSRTTMKVAS